MNLFELLALLAVTGCVTVVVLVERILGARRRTHAQELWLAVVRGLPRLREPARFTPWLFAIARRSVIDRLRTEYAREHETPVRDELSVEDPVEAVVARAELNACAEPRDVPLVPAPLRV